MPQRQRQRRFRLLEGAGRQYIPEIDDFTVLVGYLDANHGFPGDDFDDSHTDYRQRAGEILCQVRDSADLDTGRRLQLESRDHRAGVDRHHLGLDAEIRELEFQQFGKPLQSLFGIASIRIFLPFVQQLQRRQFS